MNQMIIKLKNAILDLVLPILFAFFRLFPLQNKVVATTMRGRCYADNPKYILEAILRLRKDIDLVWIRNHSFNYDVSDGVRLIDRNNALRYVYEYATAKVWIDTHLFRTHLRKRNGQFVIETWHGGLGIKKIEMDSHDNTSKKDLREIRHTCELADVFISNSDHISRIYRSAFGYDGPIFKCGYPKNDSVFKNNNEYFNVRNQLGIEIMSKILLYAPTFRDSTQKSGHLDMSSYFVEYDILKRTLEKKYGGSWTIMVKWHPLMREALRNNPVRNLCAMDVTQYNDMQVLLKACDIVMSDYSSCIFDAALLGKPCFIYATDFDEYKEKRGVYYEMAELPFPYSKNTDELVNNILCFDEKEYRYKWNQFKKRTGLYESGNASEIVAKKISQIINGERVNWEF